LISKGENRKMVVTYGSRRSAEVHLKGEAKMSTESSSKSVSASAIPLSDEQAVLDLVGSSILNLWDTVNKLTRLKATRRERYRVSIFGSARVPKDHWVYAAVRDVSAELTRLGCDIVTGGGPGLMEAANEGARLADPEATNRSVGIRIELPFEQNMNSFVTQAFEHRTFFTRLHQFVLMSDAFVVVPGGIGTILETMMIWQLLQVQQLQNTPLILTGKMYADLIRWAERWMLENDSPLASPEDMKIPVCVESGPEILNAIRPHYDVWLANRR
jgi:uncharacterized protein (TIGR00730 family)